MKAQSFAGSDPICCWKTVVTSKAASRSECRGPCKSHEWHFMILQLYCLNTKIHWMYICITVKHYMYTNIWIIYIYIYIICIYNTYIMYIIWIYMSIHEYTYIIYIYILYIYICGYIYVCEYTWHDFNIYIWLHMYEYNMNWYMNINEHIRILSIHNL